MTTVDKIPPCNIDPSEIVKLKADGILTLEEKKVMRNIFVDSKIESTKVIHESICQQTQEALQRFIHTDYQKYYSPKINLRINSYFGDIVDTFSQQTFFRTIELQKKYNGFLESNTFLVYKFFQSKKIPVMGKLEIDGIPGEKTQIVLEFLEFVKSQKRELVTLPENTPNIKELVSQVLHKLVLKYATSLQEKGKVDIAIDAILRDITLVFQEIHRDLKLSGNIFAVEVKSFIDNFLENTAESKKFVEVFLKLSTDMKVQDDEILEVYYNTFVQSLGFAIDIGANTDAVSLKSKQKEFEQFPMLQDFLTANPDFQSLYYLLPDLAKIIDKVTILKFIQSGKQDFLDLFNEKISPEEKIKILKKRSIDLLTFIENELVEKLSKAGNSQTQKEIVKKILSLSYFGGYKNTKIYQLIEIFLLNDTVDVSKVLLFSSRVVRYALEGKTFTKEDNDQMLKFLEDEFLKLDAEQRKVAEGLATEILSTSGEIVRKFTDNSVTGDIVASLLPFIKGVSKENSKYIWIAVKYVAKSFSTDITQGLGNIIEQDLIRKSIDPSTMRMALQLARKNIHHINTSLIKDIVQLIEGKIKTSLINKKGELTLQDIKGILVNSAKSWLKDYPELLQILKPNLETIAMTLLGRIQTIANTLPYKLEYIPTKMDTSTSLEYFLDTIYILQSTQKGRNTISHSLDNAFDVYGVSHLKNVRIFGKSFSENILFLLKYVHKTDAKLIFFTHAADLEKMKAAESEAITIAIKITLQLLEKAKIPENVDPQYQELLSFVQKATMGDQDTIDKKATFYSGAITRGSQVFKLYEKKLASSLTKPFFLSSKLKEGLQTTSNEMFEMIHQTIKKFGKRGLEMILSGQIYQNNFGEGSKKAFILALQESFKTHSQNIGEGQTGELFGEALGNFFSGNGLTLSEGTQRDIIYKYFLNPKNKADFAQVVQGVFQS